MNLLTLSFWNIIWGLIGFFILIGTLHLIRFLTNVSVVFIQTLTFAGLSSIARFVLAITIMYNRRTYCKNRLIYWNRVNLRFNIFWGILVILLYGLLFLKLGNKVDSVVTLIAIAVSTYLGFQALVYFLSQHVKEQPRQPYQYSMTMIRPWDYLDELYAESSLAQTA